MIILETTDFTAGFYQISQSDFSKSGLQLAIDCNEKSLILHLLGVELGNLFIADLDTGVPQEQRFTDIFVAFDIQPDDCIFSSKGMKKMLQGFIYFLYTIDLNIDTTDTGIVTSDNENSSIIPGGTLYRNADKRWNDSVISSEAIQALICEDLTVYPEFKGQVFPPKFAGIL